MEAINDHDAQKHVPTISRSRAHVIGRAVVVTATLAVILVLCIAYVRRGESPRVVMGTKLQQLPLTTALYVAFVQLLAPVIDTLQFGEQQSIIIHSGDTKWKVVRTYILPKHFFGGTSEGVTHLSTSDGLIFTGRDTIRRTNANFPFDTQAVVEKAIPANFSSKAGGGYNHIGDVSTTVYNGREVLLTSLEEPTYTKPVMMMFSVDTLEFLSACPLHQRHSSLLAVDPAAGIMYSTEFMDVSEVKRYAFPSCQELPPLQLRRNAKPLTLQGVQGAAVHGGSLYLSTNQIRSNHGDIFGVNTTSGEVEFAMDLLCGMGLSEMEGIDVREKEGQLQMLVANNFIDLFCTVTELRLVEDSLGDQLRTLSPAAGLQ